MWNHATSIACLAAPGRVWAGLIDVSRWDRWHPDIAAAELHGPLAIGTTYTVRSAGPRGGPRVGRVIEVSPEVCFGDETVVEGHRVSVARLLLPTPDGGTRLVFRLQVDGLTAGPADEAQSCALGERVCREAGAALEAFKAFVERDTVCEAA